YSHWISCLAVFAFLAVILAGLGSLMIMDSDPLWHIAAGDWILQHRIIPEFDPWSFTSGDYPWLNYSWLWEILFSALRPHAGWHSLVALNAIIIAATGAIMYAAALTRSRDGIASFIAIVLALTMIDPHLRPLQV